MTEPHGAARRRTQSVAGNAAARGGRLPQEPKGILRPQNPRGISRPPPWRRRVRNAFPATRFRARSFAAATPGAFAARSPRTRSRASRTFRLTSLCARTAGCANHAWRTGPQAFFASAAEASYPATCTANAGVPTRRRSRLFALPFVVCLRRRMRLDCWVAETMGYLREGAGERPERGRATLPQFA